MYPGAAPGYPPHNYDYHDYMNGAEGYYPAHYDPQGYTHDHHHPAFSHPAFSSEYGIRLSLQGPSLADPLRGRGGLSLAKSFPNERLPFL